MGVLLTILNIIGIILVVLLCILLFLLFAFAYMICMPFYYSIFVTHRAKTEYKFKISTFLRAIVLSGDSARENPIAIRILWIFHKNLKLNQDSDDEKLEKPEKPKEKPKEKPTDNLNPKTSDKDADVPKLSEEENLSRNEKRKFKKGKRAEIWSKIKHIWITFKNIKSYPHKKAIFMATLNLLKDLLSTIKPKRVQIRCLFGMSNPFDTGITLAAISTIRPFVNADQISIEADFENEIFEIDIDAKGWFNLLSILLPVIRYIRTKPIWVIIKHVFKRG